MAKFPEIGVKLVAEGAGKYVSDINKADSATGMFSASLSKAGGLLTGAIVAGAGAAAVALGAMAVKGITGAMSLEAQLSGIAATLGTTADEIKPLANLINDLALNPNLTVNTTQAAAAIEMLARNGLSMTQILDGAALSTVALANATGSDFALAADVMTDAMAQFGVEAENLSIVTDAITGVVTNSKFTMTDFAYALAQGGGVAATSGMEFDDFATSIAAISPLFASGSDAGTSLKTMITSLAAPTDAAAKLMKELGISAYDSDGNMLGMAEIAGQLNTAMAGLSEQQQTAAMKTIFGADAMRAAAGIAAYTEEEFRTLSGRVNTTGSALDSSATRVNNLTGALDILGGIAESASLQIGTALLPFLRMFVDAAAEAATVVLPMIVAGFEKLTTAVQLAYDMMNAGFGFWLTLETVLKTLGLEGIYPIIVYLADLGAQVLAFMQPLTDFIAQNFQLSDVMIALGVAIATFVLPILGSLLISIAAIIAPVLAVIAIVALLRTAWENNWGDIQGKTAAVLEYLQTNVPIWMENIKTFVMDALAKITAFWDTYGAQIMAIAANVWGIITGVIQVAAALIVGWVMFWFTLLQSFWAEWGDEIIAIATFMWDTVVAYFETMTDAAFKTVEAVIKLISGDWEGFRDDMIALATEMWDKVKEQFEKVKETLEPIVNGAIQSVKDLWNNADWGAIGTAVMEGIAGGITAALSWVTEAATGAANAALTAAKGVLGIQSPSKAFMEVGNEIGEGMVIGMNQMQKSVEAAGGNMAAASLRPVMSPQNIQNISNNRSTTVNFTGNYANNPTVTDSKTLTKILAGYA